MKLLIGFVIFIPDCSQISPRLPPHWFQIIARFPPDCHQIAPRLPPACSQISPRLFQIAPRLLPDCSQTTKRSPGDLLCPLSGLGPEMLQNSPLEASWAHFPGWGQKCFKTVLLRRPGLTFRAGARNASKRSPGDLLGPLSGLGPEMLQNGPLEPSWAHFPGWGQKCSKTVLWRLPGFTNPCILQWFLRLGLADGRFVEAADRVCIFFVFFILFRCLVRDNKKSL